MTSDRHHIDEQVRRAVDALPDAPVRWDRVAQMERRKNWIIIVILALVTVSLSLVIAIGFIVGKSAIDSSYTPPLISKGQVSGGFREPTFGHGLVQLSRYQGAESAAAAIASASSRRTLGYVFTVKLHGIPSNDRELKPAWKVRHRGNAKPLRLATVPTTTNENEGDDSRERTYRVWIEQPSHSGQFVVDFSLASPSGILIHETSAPFHVVTRDLLVAYRSPTYAVGVPRNWELVSDYTHASAHRFVTELDGPHGMSILIDTTLNENGDPADSARYLASQLEDVEKSYKRLSFDRRSLDGYAFEWSFEIGVNVSTDIFFDRGQDGYAVLAKSPVDRFREARLVARTIVRSLRDRASLRSARAS